MANGSVKKKPRNEVKYRAYPFVGRDPGLKLFLDLYHAAGMSPIDIKNGGGSPGALYGALHKDVKRPQFCTLAANLKVIGIDVLELIKAAKVKAR
jgi:hypothetical protein